MKKVIYGIQARSTSERLPAKVFEKIGDTEMLAHVILAAEQSANYINRFSSRSGVQAQIVLLCPESDPIVKRYRYITTVFEGSELDVLGRYVGMAEKFRPDFIVRITGDCPLIPPYLITKHVNVATQKDLDYVSNVDTGPDMITDGHDVEVVSRRALDWLNENAQEARYREHVTLALRELPLPVNFKVGHVIGHALSAGVKLSVDTDEDLERVRKHYDRIQEAINRAQKKHGKNSINRF